MWEYYGNCMMMTEIELDRKYSAKQMQGINAEHPGGTLYLRHEGHELERETFSIDNHRNL